MSAGYWKIRPGSFDVRASCPAHPDAPMRRIVGIARCSECGTPLDLCLDAFGRKECVLRDGHDGGHVSPSGYSWPAVKARCPSGHHECETLRADLAQASSLLREAEARLVGAVAAERERCALECDAEAQAWRDTGAFADNGMADHAAQQCAARIRRGETT